MKVQFESDMPKVEKMLKEMAHKVTPAAVSMSINKTATHVIKISRQEVSRDTTIPQKHIRKRMLVRKGNRATSRKPFTTIWVGVWDIPVSRLTPKPKQFKNGRVVYKVLPGDSIDPRSFVAIGKKGKSAFARKGTSRLPIKQKSVNIGRFVRRRMWMNLGGPAKRFYDKTFYSEMDGRVINEFRKRGMRAT